LRFPFLSALPNHSTPPTLFELLHFANGEPVEITSVPTVAACQMTSQRIGFGKRFYFHIGNYKHSSVTSEVVAFFYLDFCFSATAFLVGFLAVCGCV